MKKIIILCIALFATAAIAHSIDWYVDNQVYQTTSCESGTSVTPPAPPTKYGYHFVEWKDYYEQLEYIESTGTQWIDTGWYLPADKDNFVLSMTFYSYDSNTSWKGFCGVNNSSGRTPKQYYEFQVNQAGTALIMHNTDDGSTLEFDLASGIQTATISYDNGTTIASYNGETKTIVREIYERGTTPLWIFGINMPGAIYANFLSKMRLYAFSIRVDNILVRDFIPVLDPGGVACMYDKVSRTLFYNAGTGSFIAGPVLQ